MHVHTHTNAFNRGLPEFWEKSKYPFPAKLNCVLQYATGLQGRF